MKLYSCRENRSRGMVEGKSDTVCMRDVTMKYYTKMMERKRKGKMEAEEKL